MRTGVNMIGTIGISLAVASAASANLMVDFDDGINPFSGGTISTAQSVSGPNSLFLDAGQSAVLSIPAQLQGGAMTISMRIFDQGKWIDRTVSGYPTIVSGPRWGVNNAGGGAQPSSIGVGIVERSFLASSVGYGVQGASDDRFATSWFNPTFFTGSNAIRQNAPWMSSNGGSNDGVSGWQPGTAGQGTWLDVVFDITALGEVTITLTDVDRGITRTVTRNIDGPPTEIWLYGGRNHATAGLPLAGVYVDNVSIAVPEPASMGLLALGGLLMIKRRRCM